MDAYFGIMDTLAEKVEIFEEVEPLLDRQSISRSRDTPRNSRKEQESTTAGSEKVVVTQARLGSRLKLIKR